MKNKQIKSKIMRSLIKLVIFLSVFFIIFCYPIAYYSSIDEVVIVVKDKERITTGTGENIDSKFLVYADIEVFENVDSWMYFKFNSSDFQNELTVGKTYTVKVAGWRIPFFSTYRNIVKIY